MCGRYHFSYVLLDEIRELVEPSDWKLELGLLEKDMHPGDMAPVIIVRENNAQEAAFLAKKSIPLPGRTDRYCSWLDFTVSMRMGIIL